MCECCELAERFDHDRPADDLEAAVRGDLDGPVIRSFVLLDMRKGWDSSRIVDGPSPSYWQSPALFELLRLHRVGMSESAAVILRVARALVKLVRAEETEIDAFAMRDGWRPSPAA